MTTNNLNDSSEFNFLGEYQEEFDKHWNQLSNEIGSDVLNYFQKNIPDNFGINELLDIKKLTVVVDNNFLFNYVRGLVENKSNEESRDLKESFIHKFLNSGFTIVYAPPKIEKELYSKIEQKISPENIKQAKILAAELISKIQIQEAEWVDSWVKASRRLREEDPDDIDYLALVYHLNGHAIVSDDKVFEDTGAYKSWANLETKEVLLTCNKGIVALSALGIGAASILTLIKYVLALLKLVSDLILQMVILLLELMRSIVKYIVQVPVALSLFVITSVIAWFSFTEKGQEIYRNEIPKTPDKLSILISSIEKRFAELSSFMIEMSDSLKPLGITSSQIISYLILQFQSMQDQFAELEIDRMKWVKQS